MNFFQKQNPKVESTKQKQTLDPVLYSDPNPEFYLVMDTFKKNQISVLKKIIKSTLGREVSLAIIHAFIIKPKEEEMKKGVKTFVRKYRTDFSKIIPKNSKILAFGRGLYSLTKTTNLMPSAFYPIGFVDPHFYHPETSSWIFPVDSLKMIFSFEKNSVYERWESFFFRTQVKNISKFKAPSVRIPQLKLEVVEDPNQFLKDNMEEKEVAIDLETTGLIFFKHDIICISMSFDGKTGYYLDWKKIDPVLLDKFLENKFQIGANYKFDCKFLRYRGIKNANIHFDTYNAGHVLNEMRSNALSSHGWLYTFYGGHEEGLDAYLAKHPRIKNYDHIPKAILSDYAMKDAIVCFQVYKEMMNFLKLDPNLYDYYFEQAIPNLQMFLDIELEGVYIDWNQMKELKKEFSEELRKVEEQIFIETGKKFNIRSKKDLGLLLENELDLPDLSARVKDSIGGYYRTNVNQLKEWSGMGYGLADLILQHREISAFIDTFIGEEKDQSAYWEFRNGDRVHPSYGVGLANSHRNRCNNPNLQQVPAKTERAKVYRKIFSTPPGFYISEGDYAGFQLRIAAVLSGDENLKKAFVEYGDPHSMTTVGIFHPNMDVEEFIKICEESPYKEQRAIGKSSNFSFLFGGGAYSFTQDVIVKKWSWDQAVQFLHEKGINWNEDPFFASGEYIRNSFFESYPLLGKWHKDYHKKAETDGVIYSIYGARRLLPQLMYIGDDSDQKEVSNLKNIALNSPVQNFEAVVIMRAMRELHHYLKQNNMKSRIFGMVHDATQSYIHEDEIEILRKKIPEIFEKDYPEYKGIKMVYEMDLANPNDPDNPTVWKFGKKWI